MADESYWVERAQSADAKLETYKAQMEPTKERIQAFKANMGLKERSDGSIVIDYDTFAERLGIAGALELRKVIDEKYRISGAPGEKPRIRVSQEAA